MPKLRVKTHVGSYAMPPGKTYTVAALSVLDRQSFVTALEGVFEHSPWVAERAWMQRPFASRNALLKALEQSMRSASHAEQLALVRAHPELAGKAAADGNMTKESTYEQGSAGLDACSAAELELLHALNARYRSKFGHPFIQAVRGYDRAQIIALFSKRLANPAHIEFEESLVQIARIAQLRLEDRLSE